MGPKKEDDLFCFCGATAQFVPRPIFRFLDHTELDTHTSSKTHLNERLARRRVCYQTNTNTSMPSAGFEPAIPAVKWLQTYVLDSTATETGLESYYFKVLYAIPYSIQHLKESRYHVLHSKIIILLPWRYSPVRVRAASLLRFLYDTQSHITVTRTPLDE